MVRRFFRDSVIYTIPAGASAAMALVTFPLFAHHFHPASYGVLELLTLANVLALLTVDCEIYQGVGRYVITEQDVEARRRYSSTGLWWTVGCYLVLSAIVLGLTHPLNSALLGSHGAQSLIRITLLWTVAQGILNLVQAQLRWQLDAGRSAAVGAVNAVLSAGCALAFVFIAHLGIAGVLWGWATGSICGLALAVFYTRRIFRPVFDRPLLRQMLSYSAPLVLSNAGIFLNLFADRLVIQHLRSVADVGIYGVGNRVAMIIALGLTGFQAAATPLFLSRHEETSSPRTIARIFRLFAGCACAMFLFLSIFATPLVRVVAAPAYQSAAGVVPLLVASALFANMYNFAPGLVIAKRTRTMAVLSVGAGVANLGLAVALVPPLGIVGAGIATAVSSLAWFAALMAASQRHYAVPHRWVRLGCGALAAGCVAGLSFVIFPLSRADALSVGTLIGRLGLLVVGTALCGWLCLDNSDLHVLRQRLLSVRRRQSVEVT
jgi:O-antigen/teichoic acid export membrane protein